MREPNISERVVRYCARRATKERKIGGLLTAALTYTQLPALHGALEIPGRYLDDTCVQSDVVLLIVNPKLQSVPLLCARPQHTDATKMEILRFNFDEWKKCIHQYSGRTLEGFSQAQSVFKMQVPFIREEQVS
jgi:hypothetical protein